MSPKSRGRRRGHGKAKTQRRSGPVRELRLPDRLLRAAAEIAAEPNAFEVDLWASGWLGQAWSQAGLGERNPEQRLCTEIVGRVSSRPSPAGLAAVAALRRVAATSERPILDETVELLSRDLPPPAWTDEPAPQPTGAWRVVDVWDSRRVLFVGYAEAARPHTLLAFLSTAGGVRVDTLGLTGPDPTRLWSEIHKPDHVPMSLSPAPVEGVLAELADALRLTDITWPRPDDEDYVDLRVLAWSQCRDHLPAIPSFEEFEARDQLADAERPGIVEDFLQQSSVSGLDIDVVRSLAELFLDYGEGYMPDRLAWSPEHVELFLTDWVPRKAVLDAEERVALPAVLRAWLRFALHRRGVEDRWITPVVAVVEDCLAEFTEAFDDEAAWGPAKQIAAQLAARGVDLTDPDAVEAAISALNAENLARRISGDIDS